MVKAAKAKSKRTKKASYKAWRGKRKGLSGGYVLW